MQENTKKKILYLSIAFFLVFGIGLLFLFNEIKKNDILMKEKVASLKEEMAKRDNLMAVSQAIKSIEDKRDSFDSHFIYSSNVVPLLNKIEDMGNAANIKTEISLVDMPKEGDGLIIEMKSSGSFSNLYKFINLLENAPYEFVFKSFDIQKIIDTDPVSKKESSKWELDISLHLLSFIK